MSDFDRRDFLASGAALGLASWILPGTWMNLWAAHKERYTVSGWRGSEPEPCHRFRDGYAPKTVPPGETREVVIIGAGMTGLVTGFKLRQTDMVVLESMRVAGGTAQGGVWQGVHFNRGSAYFAVYDGELRELLDEAGLKFTAIKRPSDRWFLNGAWVNNPFDDESIAGYPPDLRRAFRGVKQEIVGLLQGPDFPNTPYETATAAARELDRKSLAQWMKPYAHPALAEFVDHFCYSALGAPATGISAFSGLNFMAEFLDDVYSSPQGNAIVAEALAGGIETAGTGRVRKRCHVFRVEPSGNGAIVHYQQDGAVHAIKAECVVVSVPFFVASAFLEGLSGGQRALLKTQRYCSYIVANLCFRRRVSFEAYDNWAGGQALFMDFIPAAWAGGQRPGPDSPQVITLFAPIPEAVAGRWRMLKEPPEVFAAPLVDGFERLVPGSISELREVDMTRWGHAMIISAPGAYTRWLPLIKKQNGPIFLAHTDGQALPCLETAVMEGLSTARAVMKQLS